MNDISKHFPANRPPEGWTRVGDAAAGIEVADDFERFEQRDDMFNRAFWDDSVRSKDADAFFASYRMAAAPRSGDGFNQRDFALRNAAWSVADDYADRANARGLREGFQAPIELTQPRFEDAWPVDDPQKMSAEIKRVAKFFGADLVGICEHDERWLYSRAVDVRDFSARSNELPPGISSVIVLAHEMDLDLVQTYPSALAGAAVGAGYSGEAKTVVQLASFIHNLGYHAVASMNDTALVIPYAVKAGLGEYGRNQMVITEEYGPRVRFSKIFTDLPLSHDAPKRFGVREFCDVCNRCAQECPPKALPFGPPEASGANRSAIKGVVKWTADCEKCFGYWAKLKTDCAICLRVCPYNKDFSKWYFRLGRRLAGTGLRKFVLWLDDRLGQWRRRRPKEWWAETSDQRKQK